MRAAGMVRGLASTPVFGYVHGAAACQCDAVATQQLRMACRHSHAHSPTYVLIDGCCRRLLGFALQRPEWSTAEHRRFPAPFERTVRALLLAVHRKRHGQGGTAAGHSGSSDSGAALLQHLAALPDELVMHILGQAAYPLSAWAPGTRARRD